MVRRVGVRPSWRLAKDLEAGKEAKK